MFVICNNGVELGRSALDQSDPPMGVAFGEFVPNSVFEKFRVDAPHRATDSNLRIFDCLSLRMSDGEPIECAKVYILEAGQFDDPIGWEVECHFESPLFEELFADQINAYRESCSTSQFRYASGELAALGDMVWIDSSTKCVVVGIVHTGQYSGAHKKEHWDHYGAGVLVESAETGLIFIREEAYLAELRKAD